MLESSDKEVVHTNRVYVEVSINKLLLLIMGEICLKFANCFFWFVSFFLNLIF